MAINGRTSTIPTGDLTVSMPIFPGMCAAPSGPLLATRWTDYQLLDCGDGLKQERWGPYVLVRPDPQVLWPRRGHPPQASWTAWDGFYHRAAHGGGRWEFRRPLPEHWTIRYAPLKLVFKIRPTGFKHTGLFPEQAVNWEWSHAKILAARRPINLLNLFAYTGGATCAAAAAGASVCHVDAAEGMVRWCRENASLSGLEAAPIRYIADDCLKFVRRELKRARRYDALVMDPPTFGRGGDGELWKLEDHLWSLLVECRRLLSDRPLFVLVNAYTTRLSPTVIINMLEDMLGAARGSLSGGEVGLPIAADGRTLPCGVFGRWEE